MQQGVRKGGFVDQTSRIVLQGDLAAIFSLWAERRASTRGLVERRRQVTTLLEDDCRGRYTAFPKVRVRGIRYAATVDKIRGIYKGASLRRVFYCSPLSHSSNFPDKAQLVEFFNAFVGHIAWLTSL